MTWGELKQKMKEIGAVNTTEVRISVDYREDEIFRVSVGAEGDSDIAVIISN